MTREQEQEVLKFLREIRNDSMALSQRIQSLANLVQVNTSNTTETEISQNEKLSNAEKWNENNPDLSQVCYYCRKPTTREDKVGGMIALVCNECANA